jgi:Tfp pilus assembly protein PilX
MTRTSNFRRAAGVRAQRGVALFFALIAMVVLSLGAVALIRSVDTTSSVAGNLAFRQATMAPVTDPVERAVSSIFDKLIPDLGAADPGHLYHPSFRDAADAPNGLPPILAGQYTPMKTAYAGAGYASYTDPAGYEVRYVIERACEPGFVGVDQGAMNQSCDMLPPKVSPAKTTGKLLGPKIQPFPLYRVTIRVDDPNSKTATFVQAMLR